MPAIYNLHQLSKVQPTYQTGQICSCSRHIAFYPFTTLNKSYVKTYGGGRRNLPTICCLQLRHVFWPSGRIFPLARESSPIPELPTYFQNKKRQKYLVKGGYVAARIPSSLENSAFYILVTWPLAAIFFSCPRHFAFLQGNYVNSDQPCL